jgi:hypothetical protein
MRQTAFEFPLESPYEGICDTTEAEAHESTDSLIRIKGSKARCMLDLTGRAAKLTSVDQERVLRIAMNPPSAAIPERHMSENKAADYWGENYYKEDFNRQEWQAHPLSLERMSTLLGNRTREDWFAETYVKNRQIKRALGVGVGRAETELGLLKNGAVEHFDLWDISPVGMQGALEQASSWGIGKRLTCHTGNILESALRPCEYGLVTFIASLHHMPELDRTLRLVNHAMIPEGFLWAAEYVGPDRFNYPPEHAKFAHAFWDAIPPKLRNPWVTKLTFPTPQEVEAADPSESPCSSQIVPTMQRLFPQLDVKPMYGTFPFMVFWGLDHNALYETPDGRELVRYILAADTMLCDTGVLPHYFQYFIATKNQDLAREPSASPLRRGIASRFRNFVGWT